MIKTSYGVIDIEKRYDAGKALSNTSKVPKCIDPDIRNATNEYINATYARKISKRDKNDLINWVAGQVQNERQHWHDKHEASMREIDRQRRLVLDINSKIQIMSDKLLALIPPDCQPEDLFDDNFPISHIDLLGIYIETVVDTVKGYFDEREKCYTLLNASKHEDKSLDWLIKLQKESFERQKSQLKENEHKFQRELTKLNDEVSEYKMQYQHKEKTILELTLHKDQLERKNTRLLHQAEAAIKNQIINPNEIKLEVDGRKENQDVKRFHFIGNNPYKEKRYRVSLAPKVKERKLSFGTKDKEPKEKESVPTDSSFDTKLPPVVMERQNSMLKHVHIGRQINTNQHRAAVLQCLRCHRLYTQKDNHKMACHFHPRGKLKVEKYDSAGKLEKVQYMWECCKQKPDAPPCCHGEHV